MKDSLNLRWAPDAGINGKLIKKSIFLKAPYVLNGPPMLEIIIFYMLSNGARRWVSNGVSGAPGVGRGYGFGTTAAGDAGIAGRGTVLGPPRPETLAGVRFWDQHGRKRWQGHGHGDMVLHTHRRVARCFSIRRKYFRFAYGNACSLTNTHDCSLEPSFRSRRKPAQTGGCVCPCRGPCDTHQFALRA